MLISIFGIGIAWAVPDDQVEYLRAKLREKFPDARSVSVDELIQKLESGSPLILVDTRARAEFDLSHLKGAILFEPEKDSIDVLQAKLLPQQEIVTYCSVGYRSSMVAEQLQKRGVQNIYSLDGGIFEWANSGHAVFSGSGIKEMPAKYVHPVDEKWGRLLKPELHPPQY